MKRIISTLLIMVLLIGLMPTIAIPAFAATSGTTGDCTWTLDGTELTISGNGAMGDYYAYGVLPWGTSITKVTIENGVTSIGDYAFYGCYKLVSVFIPESIVSIGKNAFYVAEGADMRHSLESVYITNIEKWCAIEFDSEGVSSPLSFARKLYLNGEPITNLVIPDGVTTIPIRAFSCDNITSVTIPEGVTAIGNGAFEDCIGLTSIIIPNSVTSIGNSAFSGCSGLTSITIPNGVTTIKSSTFSRCTGLTSITIPDSVTTIGDFAFSHCSGLASLTIPNKVTSISSWAFSDCTGLTSITIPDGVTSIGGYAFQNCIGLTFATIYDSVTAIGDGAFSGCYRLEAVFINDIAKWCSIEFYDKWSNPLYYANKLYLNNELITDLVIPEGVTSIGDYAFYYASGLTSVSIPDSVTSLSDSAFAFCSSLTSVTIPKSVTSIGSGVFENCSGLKEVELFAEVSSIPSRTFTGCYNLTRIYLPAELCLVYSDTFNSSSLRRVFFGGTEGQYESMTIQHTNDGLVNAKWSFNESGLPDHSYTNACDKDCNECGMQRTVEDHNYTNACDTDCNVCKATRSITHSFGSYVYNNNATTLMDGTKTRTCAVCGYSETVTAAGTMLRNPFTDVPKGQYYTDPVLWAVSKGITTGTSATTFSPDAACTRGQIVTFLWRAAGSPNPQSSRNPFVDVSSNQYYYKAVLWAVEKGITTGMDATHFAPDASCTRGQIVTFLHRAKGKPAASASNPFYDVSGNAYYYSPVLWAVKNGITTGTSATTFAPDAPCTRAQIVTFLYRAYK